MIVLALWKASAHRDNQLWHYRTVEQYNVENCKHNWKDEIQLSIEYEDNCNHFLELLSEI